jgi:hypothetical protein
MPKEYADHQAEWVRWIYVIGIVLWLIICYFLGLFPGKDWIEWCILFIPIIVFLFAWYAADQVTDTVEDFVGTTNVLALGLIVAMPLMNWVQGKTEVKKQFTQLLATAIILSLLTLIDIWVPHDKLPILRHAESVLQTMAISLLIFALYRYFIEGPHGHIPEMVLSAHK